MHSQQHPHQQQSNTEQSEADQVYTGFAPQSTGLPASQGTASGQGLFPDQSMPHAPSPSTHEGFPSAPMQPGGYPKQSQANYTSTEGLYPSQTPQGAYPYPPGSSVPSDSHPQSYQSMLDSMPSAQGAGSNIDGPVHYPTIQGGTTSSEGEQPAHAAVHYLAQALNGGATAWPLSQTYAAFRRMHDKLY